MRDTITWFRRWRKESYKDLYHCIYGNPKYEQDKGLKREWRFSAEICGMWANEVKRLRPLLREAQDMLEEVGLETASMKANREILAKYGIKK